MNNRKQRIASSGLRQHLGFLLLLLVPAVMTSLNGAEDGPAPSDPSPGQADTFALKQKDIWDGDIGQGFRSDVQTLSLQSGAVAGLAIFGSRQEHDLTLLSLSYGHMLGGVVGKDHWYRGNWELRGEFFGGAQVSPSRDWVVG